MTYRKKLQVALFLEIINTASTRVARHCEEPKPRAKRDGRCPLCHCEEHSDEAISRQQNEEIASPPFGRLAMTGGLENR